MRTRFLMFLLILTPVTLVAAAQPDAATLLGWIADPNIFCGGYYEEFPIHFPRDLAHKGLVEIKGNQSRFSKQGISTLTGHVTVTQTDQQLSAEKILLYRDAKNAKPSALELQGGVTLRRPGESVRADTARVNLQTQEKILIDTIYRISLTPEIARSDTKKRKVSHLSAWGTAKKITQYPKHILQLEDATYSTCPPTNILCWQLKASYIHLNKETGRGYAFHPRLHVLGVPILYLPYFNFPIDSRRKTGLLFPTVRSSTKSGLSIAAPIYLNIAPNLDATLTPRYYEKRGLQGNALFRYLIPYNQGALYLADLPHDRSFNRFKKNINAIYQTSTDPIAQANLRRLNKSKNAREAISYNNETRFNEHWWSTVNISAVSDDYYLQDLSNGVSKATLNQLLRDMTVHYQNINWHLLTRLQAYQTLHPINEITFQNQYSRLPQINLTGSYPYQKYGLDYFLTTEVTRFSITKTPGTSAQKPEGFRTQLQPGMSWTRRSSYAFVEPRLQLLATKYQLHPGPPENPNQASRTLFIFDTHGGLYFDKHLNIFKNAFRQTLEPEFYYVFVPLRHQDHLPIFDSARNTLTYEQMFNNNRFSGYDRIGDTNQLTLALTSRFINQETGNERLRASIGQIYYAQKRKVRLCSDPDCSTFLTDAHDQQYISPVAALLNYQLNNQWSLDTAMTWNYARDKADNTQVGFRYEGDPKHIWNVNYNFVRQGDIFPGAPINSGKNNLKQTNISFTWPFTTHWQSIGRWSQNWSHHNFQDFFYGFTYDSCCWAVRVVAGRTFVGLSDRKTNEYDSSLTLQFSLKGLGNIGTGDPGALLSENISGSLDNFGQGV